jgi:beta-glucosidase
VGFRDCDVSIEGFFEVPETGDYYFSCAGIGPSRLVLNDKVVQEQTDNYPDAMGFMFGGAFSDVVKVHLAAGEKHKLLARTSPPTPKGIEAEDMGLLEGHVGLQVGFMPAKQRDWDHQAEAVRLARDADIAIVFTGNEPVWETEGKDQMSFHLPKDGSQDRLVFAVADANPNTIVVNSTGVAIAMPWLAKVKGLVQSWFSGQECGNAIADILTGRTTPEGHLPCTFPKNIEDCPAYGNFPGEKLNKKLTVTYKEGIFVGYRHFDRIPSENVNFPFGFGLSYTTFDFANLTVHEDGEDMFNVSVQVTNTGHVAGGIAVQIYVGRDEVSEQDPLKILVGFKKARLRPGELETVSVSIAPRDVATFDEKGMEWVVKGGIYRFMIGRSVQDISIEKKLPIQKRSFRL